MDSNTAVETTIENTTQTTKEVQQPKAEAPDTRTQELRDEDKNSLSNDESAQNDAKYSHSADKMKFSGSYRGRNYGNRDSNQRGASSWNKTKPKKVRGPREELGTSTRPAENTSQNLGDPVSWPTLEQAIKTEPPSTPKRSPSSNNLSEAATSPTDTNTAPTANGVATPNGSLSKKKSFDWVPLKVPGPSSSRSNSRNDRQHNKGGERRRNENSDIKPISTPTPAPINSNTTPTSVTTPAPINSTPATAAPINSTTTPATTTAPINSTTTTASANNSSTTSNTYTPGQYNRAPYRPRDPNFRGRRDNNPGGRGGFSRGNFSAAYPYFMPYPAVVEGDVVNQTLLAQIEYYFSIENLCKDIYLRSQMDAEGFVPIALLAAFNRVKTFLPEVGGVAHLQAVIQGSSVLEISGEKVRKKTEWAAWLLPNNNNNNNNGGAINSSSSSNNNNHSHSKDSNSSLEENSHENSKEIFPTTSNITGTTSTTSNPSNPSSGSTTTTTTNNNNNNTSTTTSGANIRSWKDAVGVVSNLQAAGNSINSSGGNKAVSTAQNSPPRGATPTPELKIAAEKEKERKVEENSAANGRENISVGKKENSAENSKGKNKQQENHNKENENEEEGEWQLASSKKGRNKSGANNSSHKKNNKH